METPRFEEVIVFNRATLARARDLNRRAGEAIFPVMDRTGLVTWLQSRLQGARRVSEVMNSEALRLPELDQTQVERVLSECPDTILVLGENLPVEYRDEPAPLVRLTDEMTGANRWNDLPDGGITTPGGRQVEIYIKISYWDSISETDIPRLKARMRDHLNQQVWSNWDKPELALPDMTDETATIPEIREVVYGMCVVTGVELKAWGAVCNNRRYYSSDPYFKGEWFRDRAEAETKRAEAEIKLEELRREIREKAQVEAAKADAEAAKDELRSLQSREGWYDLEYDLRQTVDERTNYYSSIPSDLVGIQAWITQTRALKAQVEEVLVKMAERKAHDERERREAEETQRRELGVILSVVGGDDLHTARDVLEFAKAVESAKGAVSGAKILRKEFEATYGRANRQSALEQAIPSLRGTDAGRVLGFSKAATVNLYLEAAIAWLEAKTRVSQPAPKAAPPVKPESVDQVGGLNLAGLTDAWGAVASTSRRR